jgi:hypothetical protein
VSPDGKVIAYFAMNGSWDTYLALSKPPWLKALCAWKTIGTWTTGAHFKSDGTLSAFGDLCEERPFRGSCPFPFKFGGTDTNWNRAREFQFMMNGWQLKAADVFAENFNPEPNEVIELSKSSSGDPKLVLNKYSEFAVHIGNVFETKDRWLLSLRRYGRKMFGRKKPPISDAENLLSEIKQILELEPSISDLKWLLEN